MKQLALAFLLIAAVAQAQPSGPAEWLPVREPIQREIERLRASGLADTAFVFETRPLDRRGVAAVVARARRLHPDSDNPSLIRLERLFGRELVEWGCAAPAGGNRPLAPEAGAGGGRMRGRG